MSNNLTRNLAVTFFAGIVLLSETLFFHAAKYILDYMLAMTVISCAVAGIGLGAFLASRFRQSEQSYFDWCCGGTTACLYLAAFVLLRHSSLPTLLPAVASVFVFPSMFIARAFARGSATGTYLFDMLGAGVAVGLIVLAYHWTGTETVFLILVTAVPAAGALWAAMASSYRRWARLPAFLWLAVFGMIGATLLHFQLADRRLDIQRLVNPSAPNIPAQNMLRRPSRWSVVKSYDNLVGRLDVIPTEQRFYVTYDGFFSDNFTGLPTYDYLDYAKPHEIDFPTQDRRVLYGLVPEPTVFVIGPAADGIIKTLRTITPPDHVDSVEVNPGVLQMMQHDFYEASGQSYKGMRPVLGNALSALRRSHRKYDMITLINTHSSRWIGALGAPDFLHTRESYDLYLDHLTDHGYLLFEERPDTRRGELGVKRMILTLYDCLKRRGAKDPAQHFFIWEFMSGRYTSKGHTGIATGSDMYYVGMIVSLEPIQGKRKQAVIDWYENPWFIQWDESEKPTHYLSERKLYPAYLKSTWSNERFGPFFKMIEAGDFSAISENFDDSLVTNDRPFPSCSTRSAPEIRQLVRITSGLCLLLCGLFAVGAVRNVAHRRSVGLLLVYNVAIGLAYFLVEIMLIQVYQRVFLAPSASLAMVLGVLLIGSAAGGLSARVIRPTMATIALVPLVLGCLWLPEWAVAHGWTSAATTAAAVVTIFAVGAAMGVYFPTGLIIADQWSLRAKIPHLFAINAISGSLATVLSLWLGIRAGYTWTVLIALALYIVASVVVRLAGKPQDVGSESE